MSDDKKIICPKCASANYKPAGSNIYVCFDCGNLVFICPSCKSTNYKSQTNADGYICLDCGRCGYLDDGMGSKAEPQLEIKQEVLCPICDSKNRPDDYFCTCLKCGTYYNKDGSQIGPDGVKDNKGNFICLHCKRNNVYNDNLLYICPDCKTHYTTLWTKLDPTLVAQFNTKLNAELKELEIQEIQKKRKEKREIFIGLAIIVLVIILLFYSCSGKKSSSSRLSAQQCSVLVVAAVKSKAPGASGILFDIEGDDPDNFKAQGSFKRSGVKYIFKTWLKNGKSVYFVADPH